MPRTPQPVAYSEGEMALATALNVGTEQLRTIKRCPDCDGFIIPTDNGVWLDAKNTPDGLMGIMTVGGLMLAASPAEGAAGSRHNIHEHQPDEE